MRREKTPKTVKHTFYLPPENWHPPYTVAGQEAVHMLRVLRLKEGTRVRLMDGQGRMGHFELVSASRNQAELEKITEWEIAPPHKRLCLALACSKGLRRSWLLEKASELGAWEIAIWASENSPGRLKRENPNKWLGPVISGAKQSLNPWIPAINVYPSGLEELLEKSTSYPNLLALMETSKEAILDKEDFHSPGNIVVIGPEGGFSGKEKQLLRERKAHLRTLGNRILRWETAAMVTLSLHHILSPANS